MSLQEIVTIVGLPLTVAGLFFAGYQMRASYRQLKVAQRIAGSDFILRFDEMLFQHHDKVHQLLRPGGDWAEKGRGPGSPEDWVPVERYMGMFERIKVLLDDDLIDIDSVERFYGYRIRNIFANTVILEKKKLKTPAQWEKLSKAEKEKNAWRNFNALYYELEKHRQKRSSE